MPKDDPWRHRLSRLIWRLKQPKSLYYQFLYWPVRSFIERGRRGWSICDVWAIDYYLDRIIPEMVERLRQTGHGCPSELDEEQWNAILAKIVAGFKAHAKMMAEVLYDDAELQAEIDEGMALFIKWYSHLWD